MRLINADELIKELKSCTCTDKHDERIIKEFVVHIVKQQPIVFDIEAVVKKLEEMKLIRVEQCHEDYEIEVMTASNFDDAIEIVRKGGVKNE